MRAFSPAIDGARPVPAAGVIHLFPGQGDFPVSPLARATRPGGALREAAFQVFEQVDQVAVERGCPPLAPWLLSSRAPGGRDLARARLGTVQLALFGACLTVHQGLCAAMGEPDAVVGVSFGEIAALTAAGVFSVADGARIAHDLARVLAECPGGLTVLGCSEQTALTLVEHAGARELAVACVNDDHETVLSGPSAELTALEEEAGHKGVTATRLKLPFSSHHPALQQQARIFAAAVRGYPAATADRTVYSAVAGRAYTASDDLAARLADCLVRPALLPQVLPQAAGRRPVALYEAGTGSALSRSAQRVLADRPVTVHAPLADAAFEWRSVQRPEPT
ncbi:acyltransferase domain-containing protein [Streptacidiphilus albus]|uniref:acyltransferase domain-containing protein n=1 Tax=Streptacidiphilus albus TaxID=105425 RepID=UPI00054BE28B|nr:acyltransferase domain-containing protein [Streptacidiphilus albus]